MLAATLGVDRDDPVPAFARRLYGPADHLAAVVVGRDGVGDETDDRHPRSSASASSGGEVVTQGACRLDDASGGRGGDSHVPSAEDEGGGRARHSSPSRDVGESNF